MLKLNFEVVVACNSVCVMLLCQNFKTNWDSDRYNKKVLKYKRMADERKSEM